MIERTHCKQDVFESWHKIARSKGG